MVNLLTYFVEVQFVMLLNHLETKNLIFFYPRWRDITLQYMCMSHMSNQIGMHGFTWSTCDMWVRKLPSYRAVYFLKGYYFLS